MLCRRRVLASIGALIAAGGPWRALTAEEPVRIGGTGSGSVLMQRLAALFLSQERAARVNVLMPPMGSAGSLRALAAGRLDIAVTSRMPEPEQIGSAEAWEFARTAIVLATRDGERPGGFTRAELVDVFSGRTAKWDDGQPIRLIMRHARESDFRALKELSPQVSAALEAAERRPGMVFAEHDLNGIELLSRTPGSLGTTTLGMMKLTGIDLRVLRLDGQAPSLQRLADGSYPLVKRIFVVAAPAAGPAVRRFLGFLRSDAAREALKRYDHIPAAAR